MEDMGRIHYFLGAPAPKGFYSLYGRLAGQAETVYILKGGPCCGKTKLLRRTARRSEELGEQVEYILCPGDPERLDGLVLPERKVALIDGTAPHVVEPMCPGGVERYVDLSGAYDHAALRPLRGDLTSCLTAVRDHQRRVGRCLGAAEEISRDVRAILTTPELREKAARRAQGIIRREFRAKSGGSGQVRQFFLDAVTARGLLRLEETARTLCRRLYVLEDSWGLAHVLLAHLLGGAVAAGYSVIACPSPLSPGRLRHLLIPELSLGFLSADPALPDPDKGWRTVNMDAMTGGAARLPSRPRLRFAKKMTRALLDEAAQAVAQARDAWAATEALYRPHVDPTWTERAAQRLNEEIFGEALDLPLRHTSPGRPRALTPPDG